MKIKCCNKQHSVEQKSISNMLMKRVNVNKTDVLSQLQAIPWIKKTQKMDEWVELTDARFPQRYAAPRKK